MHTICYQKQHSRKTFISSERPFQFTSAYNTIHLPNLSLMQPLKILTTFNILFSMFYFCPVCCCCSLIPQLFLTLLRSCELQPTRLLCPWDIPSKITGVICHFLLQGIFPTKGTKATSPHLLHFRQILFQLSHQGMKPPLSQLHLLKNLVLSFHFPC